MTAPRPATSPRSLSGGQVALLLLLSPFALAIAWIVICLAAITAVFWAPVLLVLLPFLPALKRRPLGRSRRRARR